MEFDSNSYPLLRSNGSLIEAILSIESNIYKLISTIEQIQNDCHHKLQDNRTEDLGYNWGIGYDSKIVIDNKTCNKCGFTKARPLGAPWEVCYICWRKMKLFEITTPEYGEKMYIYRCTSKKCRHTVYGELITSGKET